jgi:hypothetical protein
VTTADLRNRTPLGSTAGCYLSGLSRPEQVVHFFRQILGVPFLSKEVLSQRTNDYQNWVEAFASNHHIRVQWAQRGVRKEDQVVPRLRRMRKKGSNGVYFIFKSIEQRPTFRINALLADSKLPITRLTRQSRTSLIFWLQLDPQLQKGFLPTDQST